MNDFADNSDWEKLVALSDDELDAAIAKQKDRTPPPIVKTQVVKPSPNFYGEATLTSEQSDEFNAAQGDLSWDNLLEQESKSLSEGTEYPDWEGAVSPNISSPGLNIKTQVEDVIPNWDNLNDIKTNDPIAESWQIASDDVNTEFMKEWEQSAAKISELTGLDLSDGLDPSESIVSENPQVNDSNPVPVNFISTEASDDFLDWNTLSNLKNNDSVTESWQIASDDVNTEFMKEWEQSAAKISELTGIDLSDGLDLSESTISGKAQISSGNPSIEPQERNFDKDGKMLPPTSSDESGPLPPLPVLPAKKSQSKKSVANLKSDDWFEKYQDRSPESQPPSTPPNNLKPAFPISAEPKPTYDFDELAEEICDADQFSWTNLNQQVKSQPQPKPAKGWNPSPQIVIDLEDEPAESTAVWNYNPPESFSDTAGEISAFKPKFNFNLTPALSQIWQKFKIPMIAIATLAGLFAIYSIPPIQRAVTEAGLKSQLFKDANRKDLTGANFQDAKLERVNFGNANLKNVNFKRANLINTNFEGANLKGANFSGANLRAAKLKDSKIELKGDRSTKLEPRDLLMWQIVNQPMSGRNLSRQNLDGFYLGSAVLKKANLTEAKLAWVNFLNADLSEAQLVGANLTGVNLAGANLTGANLTGFTWNKYEPKTDNTTTCPNGKKGPCQF